MIDEAGEEVPTGQEGDLAIKVKPNRPAGLFSRYVVSINDKLGLHMASNSEGHIRTSCQYYPYVNY